MAYETASPPHVRPPEGCEFGERGHEVQPLETPEAPTCVPTWGTVLRKWAQEVKVFGKGDVYRGMLTNRVNCPGKVLTVDFVGVPEYIPNVPQHVLACLTYIVEQARAGVKHTGDGDQLDIDANLEAIVEFLKGIK